jgi:hypothetical protein
MDQQIFEVWWSETCQQSFVIWWDKGINRTLKFGEQSLGFSWDTGTSTEF